MSRRAASKIVTRISGWPPDSPSAANAWLLLVTNKPPTWRDPLYEWVERPLTLGSMHEGFLYPDPLGFWDEVRRWSVALLRARERRWDMSEALAVTGLVHVGEAGARLALAMSVCRPRVVLFLDEPAWQSAGWDVRMTMHHIPDPHRDGKVYQGFWGTLAEAGSRDIVVGKAPQHPSSHRFYRREDMNAFLASLPRRQ